MSEMKLDAFKKQLKAGTIQGAYILYGRERYLLEHYSRELRRAVLGAEDDPFNLRLLDGRSLDIRDLEEAVDAYPSFAPRSYVEVRDLDLFKCGEDMTKRLLTLLETLPAHCCLTFLYDSLEYKPDRRRKLLCEGLKQHATAVEFPPQAQGELLHWLQRHFSAYEKTIDAEDAKYLVFLCGGLMDNLGNEIEKVALYAKDDTVTRADIDAVVTPVVEAETFRLTDALAARDHEKAAELMHKLFQLGTEPIAINAMVGAQLRKLYAARLVRDAGGGVQTLMALLGASGDYMPRQYLRICGNFSNAWYVGGIRRSAQTDYRMKSTNADAEALLCDLFIYMAAAEA